MDKEQIRQRWAKATKDLRSVLNNAINGSYFVATDTASGDKLIVLHTHPQLWEQIMNHIEAHADAQQDVHDLLTALDVAEAKVVQMRKALLLYVEEFAGIHEEGCPEDDTCTCEKVRLTEEALKEGK